MGVDEAQVVRHGSDIRSISRFCKPRSSTWVLSAGNSEGGAGQSNSSKVDTTRRGCLHESENDFTGPDRSHQSVLAANQVFTLSAPGPGDAGRVFAGR